MTKTTEIDFSNPDLFVPVYIPLFTDRNRTKIIYGSRGSAKSFFVCQRMVIKCLQAAPGAFKCLMVRKVKADVKASIFATIQKVCKMWKIEHLFKFQGGEGGSSGLKITCLLNGNTFLPKGTNETLSREGNAKGVENPTDAIIDEADQISESEYEDLTLSLRGSPFIEEYLIFNPTPEDHWIIKRFFPPKEEFEKADGSHTYIESTVSNATILHTTYLMNNKIGQAEIEQFEVLKKKNFERYQSQGLGLLKAVKTGGEALRKFNREIHVSKEAKFDRTRRVLEVWDFNRRPWHTVGLWQLWYDKPERLFRIDLIKEFKTPEASVREVQKDINAYLKTNLYEPRTIRLIGDHNGTHSRDSDIDSFIAKIEREIKRDGFEVRNETRSNPSVVTSLEFLDDILGGYIHLADESNFPGVAIAMRLNPECSFHVADFQKTLTDKEGRILKITKTEKIKDGEGVKNVTYQIRGHAVDASRYAVIGAFDTEFDLFKEND